MIADFVMAQLRDVDRQDRRSARAMPSTTGATLSRFLQ
jgi:hypothetical protein